MIGGTMERAGECAYAALVIDAPGHVSLQSKQPAAPKLDEVVVETSVSGISTGTERMLWNGTMPSFPGLAYPLVPGYESVGTVIEAGAAVGLPVGTRVFVPGARGHADAASLFGATASRLVSPAGRVHPIDDMKDEDAVLLALAATAYHALAGGEPPELVVGHGTLGRLMARIAIALGHAAPTVWETDRARHGGATGYDVVSPADDDRFDYRTIVDVSGDNAILDTLVARGSRGVEIVLAGFYGAPLSLTFPPAFMREARLRIAAEFTPADLEATIALVRGGRLDLSGIVTHRASATEAANAYATAFSDPACLKMILDWSDAR